MEGTREERPDDLASALQLAAAAAMNQSAVGSDAIRNDVKVSDILRSSPLYSSGIRAQGGESGKDTEDFERRLPDLTGAFNRVGVSDANHRARHDSQSPQGRKYTRRDSAKTATPVSSGQWQQFHMQPETTGRISNRGSMDVPRIEVLRPSQQDPMAMQRLSYEHTGPPTIIRDADGQEYLVQPVRESIDLDYAISTGSLRSNSIEKHNNRPKMNRTSVDELYSPFGGPFEDKSMSSFEEITTEPSDGGMRYDMGRTSSNYPSGGSTGRVGTMYYNSLRHSCPVNIEVRHSLASTLESRSISGSLPDETNEFRIKRRQSSIDDEGVDQWEIDLSELEFGPRIGRGAYGEVFRGLYRETEVAIKVFLEQDLPDKVLDAFKKEVAILKQLRHPNILQFMGACMQPPHLCIVSEFEPNGSLFQLLHRSNRPISLAQKIQIALDTAIGMNYLHTCKPPIIHGDLKSANLLLNHDFRVKVCDFGLSRVKLSSKMSVGSKLGTPEWTAPEALQSSVSNEASDVYSFGVVLWEIFARKIPWEDVNAMQVIIMVGFHNERLSIPEDVPAWAKSLIQDCFKSADGRPTFRHIISRLRTARASLDD